MVVCVGQGRGYNDWLPDVLGRAIPFEDYHPKRKLRADWIYNSDLDLFFSFRLFLSLSLSLSLHHYIFFYLA